MLRGVPLKGNYDAGGEQMSRISGLTGDEAVALAAKQCDIDVLAAYPITPQTIIVERFSEFVANGEVDTEFVCVESEHSALSACIGASLTGARVFTATSSQGLALMHEVLFMASGMRCPIVMAVVNRALSSPINIHGDHSDMMASRDCGWIQIYAENPQEAYDLTIQAFKISEDPEVQLPSSVNLDGFIISHSMERVEILEDAAVRSFLGKRKAALIIDTGRPMTFGALALPDYYSEFKRQQEEAARRSIAKVAQVGEEFGTLTGRRYQPVQAYMMEDAEAAIACMGSVAGTARAVVNSMRSRGHKVGAVKIQLYRPFPREQLRELLSPVKAIAVFTRAVSFGAPNSALSSDIKSTFYDAPSRPTVIDFVGGLGGRDVTLTDIEQMLIKALESAKRVHVEAAASFVGVRE
jgi:pyruvate ferredoxin oxidoreductase alpha subunit